MSGTNLLPVAAPASPATSSLTPEPTPVDVNGATATQAPKKGAGVAMATLILINAHHS